MAGKTVPSVYQCECGFEHTGHNLQFCGQCGKQFNKINGKDIYTYLNMCDCSWDNPDKICKKCGSYPIPMLEDELSVYTIDLSSEIKELETEIDKMSKVCRYRNSKLAHIQLLEKEKAKSNENNIRPEVGRVVRGGPPGVGPCGVGPQNGTRWAGLAQINLTNE